MMGHMMTRPVITTGRAGTVITAVAVVVIPMATRPTAAVIIIIDPCEKVSLSWLVRARREVPRLVFLFM